MAIKGKKKPPLTKSLPESVPDLFGQFGLSQTAEQDQLLLTSLSIELREANLTWKDLGNLLRYQLVAHRKPTMSGVVQALKAHPNHNRLSPWSVKFLDDIARRKTVLSEKQISCLQSISDSLELADEEWEVSYWCKRGKQEALERAHAVDIAARSVLDVFNNVMGEPHERDASGPDGGNAFTIEQAEQMFGGQASTRLAA